MTQADCGIPRTRPHERCVPPLEEIDAEITRRVIEAEIQRLLRQRWHVKGPSRHGRSSRPPRASGRDGPRTSRAGRQGPESCQTLRGSCPAARLRMSSTGLVRCDGLVRWAHSPPASLPLNQDRLQAAPAYQSSGFELRGACAPTAVRGRQNGAASPSRSSSARSRKKGRAAGTQEVRPCGAGASRPQPRRRGATVRRRSPRDDPGASRARAWS